MKALPERLQVLGLAARRVKRLEGDASTRRFHRVWLSNASTVVVAEYLPGEEETAARDAAVQAWGLERNLPIPALLAHGRGLVVSADLGDEDLERALRERGETVLSSAIEALAAFQGVDWRDAPNRAFDARLFRNELAVFEAFCPPPGGAGEAPASRFLDGLAERLAQHPYRLAHRDFHANNLFLAGGRIRAVDFQDLRGGPDTYDLVSLLRERAGARLVAAEEVAWTRDAAATLSLPRDWERRYTECAAQRGLKVIGTFVRLAAAGRMGYRAWLPAVRERTAAALRTLEAPTGLVARVERGEGHGENGERGDVD